MKIQVGHFGFTKEGKEVKKYTLFNDFNYSISILNYGGIINEINVPDKNGKVENIVFGYHTIDEYEKYSPYFGCITGRTAGRTSGAAFMINETLYTLSKNDGENHLHGGHNGFDKVIWEVATIIEKDYIGLSLNYLSPHLEEGYPGNLDTIVTYKWNNENELTVCYKATTDQETPITLTNHSYFNLSGDLSSHILDHELQIDANQFVKIKMNSIPYDVCEVEGTPFDFRQFKSIGLDISSDHEQIINGKGYDHPFVLNHSENPQASLYHKESGRKLAIYTDEKCIVCYSGNFLYSDMYIYDNVPIKHRGGVCLETQYFPDSLNFTNVDSQTLKPFETYRHSTRYHFSTVNNAF